MTASKGTETSVLDELPKYGRRIRGWLVRFGVPLVDLDDVAQDVVGAAIRYQHSYDPTKGSLGAWLRKIAYNVALQYFQRRGELPAELTDDLESDRETPEQSAFDAEMGTALAKVVAALDADERELLRLRFAEGMTAEEIGEELGIPEGTVRSRLHRILERCHKALRRMGIEDRPGSLVVPLFLASSTVERMGTGGAESALSAPATSSSPLGWIRRIFSSRPAWAVAGGLLAYLFFGRERPELAASFTWTHVSIAAACSAAGTPEPAPVVSPPPSERAKVARPINIAHDVEPVRELGRR